MPAIGHDSLAMYSIDSSTGKLTAWDRSLPKPGHVSLVSTRLKLCLLSGSEFHKLAAYRIDPATGVLTQFATWPVGQSPAWVLVKTLK
ncbi:MAG: hypothetical protein R3C11_16860 [Planctomycetaceae bacterium]